MKPTARKKAYDSLGELQEHCSWPAYKRLLAANDFDFERTKTQLLLRHKAIKLKEAQ